jgi:shikimate 5-dehydrogenase
LTQAPNDKKEVTPILNVLQEQADKLGAASTLVNGYQQGRKSGGKGIERGFVFARQGLLEGARRASANDPWRAALVIGVW